MRLYERWCQFTKEKNKRKHYWTYVEKDGGLDKIRNDLVNTIRSHYDHLERIAEDVERLGYDVASKILSATMRQTTKGSSGDLGEILATELVEEEIGLRFPVRRLRYKDGVIYMGQSCDTQAPQFGKGVWGWANGGVRIQFVDTVIGFPRQVSLFSDGRCRM
ncbi:DUF1837 domain-containing protein [Halomonas sp. M5N1S17]|uniref:DUF1837 domain-containing protein n=1 Tax=Halomonas alkalisoli TaxID=2907158 RepID=UPI001F205377|nr:DUF1837 domain-containing protein [Halomonas alkalisoli]MCE9662977.1 DUF1837 domain-containing protein [Halomonas alkalisoli]